MSFRSKKLPNRVRCVSFLVVMIFSSIIASLSFVKSQETHVYYGFVPPSTDLAGVGSPWGAAGLAFGLTWNTTMGFKELIDGQTQLILKPPKESAALDIIGIYDDTHMEIWDLVTKDKLFSGKVDRLKKQTYYIPFGTFFKVVSDRRIAVYLWGGLGYVANGADTFYPSSEGGFVGKDFIFISAAMSDSYMESRRGVNFFLGAAEDTSYEVMDSLGKVIYKGDLKQRGVAEKQLWCRIPFGEQDRGAGNSMIFNAKSSGKSVIASLTEGTFMAVPSLTGGFVGRLFIAPAYITVDAPGGTAALVITPIKPGGVQILDQDLNVVAEKTFDQNDIDGGAFWFYTIGKVRAKLLIKSEGDITVVAGTTRVKEDPMYLGDDITFTGAKANQEIRFYTPTSAIVFFSAESNAIVDGEERHMSADEYLILGSGVHSVKADKEIIVQILGSTSGWYDWGSYLVEPLDLTKTIEEPEELFRKAEGSALTNITMWVAVVGVIIVIAAAFLVIRRKKL